MLKRRRKEATVACFNKLALDLPGGAEEIFDDHRDSRCCAESRTVQ